ncbi:winged helix-turn-helix domain-containing protein [Bradyrhizobium sp. NDS-1]|uniref:winged helix-turn-helix domain-containing protein n=1 Tax=Bradyrhizobium sp. NDS-1 TaxID=3080014 RepID=UPI00293EABE5|nr:winged helix-turn-helix domain-containing protein [Bradyrhizobium sp. NDS-1]WOH76159.1 winged helix-turn-helix domain-containing protein [Bradyrhizobium sp. NDS-1]
MSDESKGIDPYETVLADLYAKRDQIAQAIAAIEGLRGGAMGGSSNAGGAAPSGGASKPNNGSLDHPGALLGMSIVDAAKALLAHKRTPLKNPDFAAMFKAGGLHMNSKEPANTIGSVLTRRMTEVGDVVRVGRGTWGLKEWYPNRSFKVKDDEKKDDKKPQQEPGKIGLDAALE